MMIVINHNAAPHSVPYNRASIRLRRVERYSGYIVEVLHVSCRLSGPDRGTELAKMPGLIP
jgi:hypothetical protein